MPKKILEVNNIWFKYNNKDIIKNVSFSIEEGEYVCIVGHNGSGKSTLSKILVGLLRPYRGTIKINDKLINKNNSNCFLENIGIVFQNPDSQFVGQTVEDDLAFGLENKQISRENIKKIISKISDKIDISNLLDQEPHNLSGGQKQKVAIASVLAINPNIIIFDESTSMLDSKSKIEINKIMLDLNKNENKTIVSITHDMDEILNASKIIVMNKGQIYKIDEPKNIFKDVNDLLSLNLDLPFYLKLSLELKKSNNKIKPTFDKSNLVEQICKIIK